MNKFSRKFLLTILLVMLSTSLRAGDYNYHADVKGMVCAFCAYTVSKNISELPGVDADSVDVNLIDGNVIFNSEKEVSQETLTTLFSDSGFTLSNLTLNKNKISTDKASNKIVLDMTLDLLQANELAIIIEAIGQYATNGSSRVIIEAPKSEEKTILGPLLMGRQAVIKVRFIPTETDKIHLQIISTDG